MCVYIWLQTQALSNTFIHTYTQHLIHFGARFLLQMTLGKCNNVDTTVVLDIEYRVVMLRCDIFLKTQYGLAHFKYLWHFDDTFSTVFIRISNYMYQDLW